MSNYVIDGNIYKIAKKLGVIVKVSNKNGKKLDIYDKNNNYICSIGSLGHQDYWIYRKQNPILAMNKRNLYLNRHKKDLEHYPRGFFASRILWNYDN